MERFASSSLDVRCAVVARLRAAGCVFAEDEAHLLIAEAQSPAHLLAMLDRRTAGIPLEHVLGWAEFCGLRIAVDPGVFVPRRRTEFLVEVAATIASSGAVVVDLCCGSGAIGVALAGAVDGIELHASDIDPAAVRCARRNVIAVGGDVHEGDLFDPLPARLEGRVRLLVANAPYVPSEAIRLMVREARDHEPRLALDGGADGLSVQRRLAAAAPLWLAENGHLLMETTATQVPQTVAILRAHGLIATAAFAPELDAAVVIGTTTGP
jgi:release factor glutamine methyltransferase